MFSVSKEAAGVSHQWPQQVYVVVYLRRTGVLGDFFGVSPQSKKREERGKGKEKKKEEKKRKKKENKREPEKHFHFTNSIYQPVLRYGLIMCI